MTATTTYTSLDRMDETDDTTFCDDCGLVFPECMLDDDGHCDACVRLAASRERAEETRDDAQAAADEAQGELDDAQGELDDLLAQVQEAKERVREARKSVARTTKRLDTAEATVEALAA